MGDDYPRAESLIAPLFASRDRLGRYERCRLDFVMAMVPARSLSAAYDAALCMAREAPGSDDAKRELALFTYRLNRPREAVALLRELDPDRGLVKGWEEYWAFLAAAYHLLGDHERELDAARDSKALWPGSMVALRLEARAHATLGRLDDVRAAVAAMRSLPSRDRLGIQLGYVAAELWAHGHQEMSRELFEEAIGWCRSRLREGEDLRAYLADYLYRVERWDEAEALYRELAEQDPGNATYLAGLGRVAARRGDRAAAMRISEQLRTMDDRYWERDRTAGRARIAALLGDREEATALLRLALDQGYDFGYTVWVHRDSDLESLWDYPPYQELMRPKG